MERQVSMSFKIGDNIVYAGSGVCQIEDIKDMSFFKEKPQKYYVLKPLFITRSQFVYVPFDNEEQVSRIRPVASKKEAIALIDKLPIDNCSWIEDRNERKVTFTDIIVNGTREDIAGLINLISRHAEKLSKEGKRLNAQDEKALSDAKNRVNNEIAIALDMEPDGVADMIYAKIGLEDFA